MFGFGEKVKVTDSAKDRLQKRYEECGKAYDSVSTYRVVEEFFPLYTENCTQIEATMVLAAMNRDQHKQIEALTARIEALEAK
jgi:hypothetical protein